MKRPALVVAAGIMATSLAVAALTGCTPAPAPTVFVTETPKPAETIVVTATPTSVASAPPVDTGNIGPDPLVPNAPAKQVVEGPADDLGPRDGARGSTTSNGDGSLATYTVVSGDSFFDIAQRFDLPQQQLLRMNPSIPDFGQEVYIGQVINIDWTTTR